LPLSTNPAPVNQRCPKAMAVALGVARKCSMAVVPRARPMANTPKADLHHGVGHHWQETGGGDD